MLNQDINMSSIEKEFSQMTIVEQNRKNTFNAIKNFQGNARGEPLFDEDLFRMCVCAEKMIEGGHHEQRAIHVDKNKAGIVHSLVVDCKRKTYYIFLNKLGMIQAEGAFGKVKSVLEVSGVDSQPVVRDLVRKTALAGEEISETEVALMQKYQQGVCKVTYINAKGEEKTALMMEAFDNDLYTTLKIRGFSVREKGEMIGQLAKQLFEIHKNKHVHYDLKPDNILFRERPNRRNQVQIADFGAANPDENPVCYGTEAFSAPEMLEHAMSRKRHIYRLEEKQAHDMYALGMIIFMMIEEMYPRCFYVDSLKEIVELQRQQWRPLSFIISKKERGKYLNDKDLLKYFAGRLLDPQPSRRITSEQLYKETAALRDAA